MPSSEQTGRLTAEAIVEAAVAIADRDGLDAVSMRRVGADLGYSGMSLYGYVRGKDELLEQVADHILGEVPEIDSHAPWDLAVINFFTALHDVLLRHPAAAQIYTSRPTRGPNPARHGRRVLAVLTEAGMSAKTAVEAFIALSCYTVGAALYTTARSSADGLYEPGWIGFDDEDDASGDALAHLWEHLAVRTGPPQFRSGLEHLVAGYATEVAGHA